MDLHRGLLRELQQRHDGFRQNDLEALRLLVLAVRQNAHPPDGRGLTGVELDLLLGLPPEVTVLGGGAVQGADACGGNERT